MPPEAEVIEAPASEAAVDTSLPAENTVITPEIPANVPEAVTGPTDVAVYQDVVAKYNEDQSYQMTDAESDVYLSVTEQINNKEIETPVPQKLKGEESAIPEKEESPEVTPEVKDEIPAEPNADEPSGDSVSDSMMESMKKVGAKDVTELPGKIDSLIRNRDESGGKLGTENAGLKTKVETLEQNATNHINWIEALRRGEPEAVKFLTEKIGYNPNGNNVAPATESGIIPDEDFLDDKLAGVVNSQKTEIAELKGLVENLITKNKTTEDAEERPGSVELQITLNGQDPHHRTIRRCRSPR